MSYPVLNKTGRKYHGEQYTPIAIFSSLHVMLWIQNENVICIPNLKIINQASEKNIHHININLPKSFTIIPVRRQKSYQRNWIDFTEMEVIILIRSMSTDKKKTILSSIPREAINHALIYFSTYWQLIHSKLNQIYSKYSK